MASVVVLLLVIAAAITTSVNGCAAPHGGCMKDVCAKYSAVTVATVSFPGADYSNPATWLKGDLPLIGHYLGDYNKQINSGSYDKAGVAGTPALNLERFDLETNLINPKTGLPYAWASSKTNLVDCCIDCAMTDDCYLFQFFPPSTPSTFNGGVACYLLSGGSATWTYPERGTPFSGSARKQKTGARVSIPMSFVGGRCNGTSKIIDDPHFTGAHGTRFDFNGEIGKSFCLTTDEKVHINALLKGYKDSNTEGATVGSDGKALRTWIREVAIMWKDAKKQSHTLHLVARDGKQQERGDGFMSKATLDGKVIAIPTVAKSGLELGDLQFTFTGTETKKHGEEDYYKIKIGSILEMTLSMRVAHKKLQAPDEAEAHFNLMFNKFETTQKIHGVLGQTYRNTDSQVIKAFKYSQISQLLGGPVQADGQSGSGFLEGEIKDYETTSVTSPDCRFSAFV